MRRHRTGHFNAGTSDTVYRQGSNNFAVEIPDEMIASPQGRHFHVAGCPLTTGDASYVRIAEAQVLLRKLMPCACLDIADSSQGSQ